jgi:2-haloacid dehalogenase
MIDWHAYSVLTFDCYGTLIDWERGILSALRPVMAYHEIEIADAELLTLYARFESEAECGQYRPYREVLREVVRQFGEHLDFTPDLDELDGLADSIKHWPPFEDTVDSLHKLKSRYKLAIVSNIDDDLFAGSQRLLKVDFDYVITAAQAKAYKPSHVVFQKAFETIEEPKDKILHVAQSLFHDHVPARELGLGSVWINRRSSVPGSGATPQAAVQVDTVFPDLASMVDGAGLA